eukprot:CAMPEP_0172158446 /NCGR_PEP_ID=MMETSP1050-20130122/4376_1 /TAXON_ID=233186 /ORGANISM="Cryptomonas curvata, Strain CCAP979/52" /LENGTH=90 /DNA_ID=CAMNT_0012827837 /DNA_START=24 /DNA_END=296 /DNA_ORIENTATION=-
MTPGETAYGTTSRACSRGSSPPSAGPSSASHSLRPGLRDLKFGEERDGGAAEETGRHVESLQPTLLKLQQLERQAQQSFLSLRARWNVSS